MLLRKIGGTARSLPCQYAHAERTEWLHVLSDTLFSTYRSIHRFIIICVSIPPQTMMRLAKGQTRQAPRHQTQVKWRAEPAVRRLPFACIRWRRIVELLRWVSQRVVEALVPLANIAIVKRSVARRRQGVATLVRVLLPLAVVAVVKRPVSRWGRRVGALVGCLVRI